MTISTYDCGIWVYPLKAYPKPDFYGSEQHKVRYTHGLPAIGPQPVTLLTYMKSGLDAYVCKPRSAVGFIMERPLRTDDLYLWLTWKTQLSAFAEEVEMEPPTYADPRLEVVIFPALDAQGVPVNPDDIARWWHIPYKAPQRYAR